MRRREAPTVLPPPTLLEDQAADVRALLAFVDVDTRARQALEQMGATSLYWRDLTPAEVLDEIAEERARDADRWWWRVDGRRLVAVSLPSWVHPTWVANFTARPLG